MKRGDVFSAATGSGFGSKPRPVVIVQSPDYDGLGTRLVVPLSSAIEDLVFFRPRLEPDKDNRLRLPSAAMIDIVLTVRTQKFGRQIGALTSTDLMRVEYALLTILGITA